MSKKDDEGERAAAATNEDATGGGGKEMPVMFESLMNVLALNKDVLKTCGTKALLKLLASSVTYTQNRYKRAEVRTFLKYLKNPKYAAVQQTFYSILLESVSHREFYVSTLSSSKTSLELLKWITIVANGSQSLSTEFAHLLALLSSRVQGKRFERSAEKKICGLFASLKAEVLTSVVKTLMSINVGIVAVSLCVKHLTESKKLEEYAGVNGFPSNAELLDLFGRECLMTKVSKSSWVLEKSTEYMLGPIVDAKVFEETVLPVIKKAMLRSPEIAIEGVGFCLKAMKFDLSPYAGQFSKILSPNLHSQEEVTRHHAAFASLALSLHINNPEAYKELIGWYFDVFNGKEGKLTVAAHKINILHSIDKIKAGCCSNLDKPSRTDVSKFVIVRCVKVLETEVHEGTLIEVVDLASSWGEWLGSDFPSELTNYLNKVLPNSKGSLRTSLGRLVSSVFATNVGATAIKPSFQDMLVKSFEKSFAQVTQVHGLSECYAFASAILEGETQVPDALKANVWELCSHVSEKFVQNCNLWTLDHIALVSKQLFVIPVENIPESFWTALAYVLTARSHEVRVHSLGILSSDVLKAHYRSLIASIKIVFTSTNISDHIKEEVLKGLSKAARDFEAFDRETIAMNLLWPAHMCAKADLWVEVSQSLKVDPGKLLSHRHTEVFKNFIKQFDGTDLMKSTIKTISFVMGEPMVKYAVAQFKENLSDPEILKVTREEYFVYRTPEGQLFDTSVIDAADDTTKNMKRESRVYSYKEQLEEIQLRKELEEKRKLSGKPVVYSAKQKEAIKLQLAKESAIREKVAKLYKSVEMSLGLMESSFEGNPGVFGLFIKDFIQQLIEIMQSPVAADDAVAFFVSLAKSYFQPESRGVAVAQRSLKMISPACDLPKEWQQEPLLSGLYPTTDYLLKASRNDIDGASFSYCFPMLRLIVQKYPKDSRLLTSVLNVILNVVKDSTDTLKHKTSYIPRCQIVELLYGVIGVNDGLIQHVSVAAVLETTKLVASESTIDLLEPKEVELHLDALTSHLKICRETGLKSLNLISSIWKSDDKVIWNAFAASIYRERFDSASELCAIAQKTWDSAGLSVDDSLYGEIFRAVTHPCEEVRTSASKALAAFLKSSPNKVDSTVQDLIASYHEYEVLTPPLVDNFGRLIQEGIDKWEGRSGVGLAIREMATEISPKTARSCFEWLVTTTLSDRSQAVHNVVLEAAVEIVQVHGTECLNDFIATIETYLEKVGSSGQYDNVRQACVVLMGSLARHLDPTDSRVKSIFGTLIDTLSTPSEKVQESVANCLPALVPAVSSESATILKRLLDKLMEAENFGERRGAAYGIAGMIKGLGILSLKQHDIMNILATGMQNKKNYRNREGALMALELLCEFLGRLFEPYIVHVLPYLLQCLGDSNVYVREATENTAKRVMSRLSGHGVKLVLPALIGALNEDSWRTKCGSVELLGRMAYCAPKQLSGCLPMIVPRLIEVLGDSHVKVQEAGAKALGLIGSVIQNPEIQSVVPVLLQALQDPGKKSTSCLNSLLATEFVHFVDPPSLALIMPVVQRAFQDRSTENRKMACQVIGNMYSLTDHSDLAPYMENVMPGIKQSLVDPVPEVRAVAAKALGAMARGMGEKCYDELLPWLMKTLVSEANSVDRSGAAQGLAEVIGSLGEDKLHRFMPEIIRKADSDDLAPHVRDGYMMMFIYMPGVFENEFVQYIGQIINPILKALADENEFVRDTALRAGQRIVTGFAESAIALLLPELEKGIFDDNWRIRFSSIQLLGDLLYKISGVSGKMSTESAGDDDNFGTEQSQQTIIAALGLERRNRVLAGLYMGRSDVALMVRQAALHVWKVVVANTPKTLREILPTLFSLLLGCLASHSHDKRQVAARTLGDLVRKLGEKILPEIIPILEAGLDSPRADEREGVCIGLSEIMASTSKEMILAFVDNLVPTLRKALCDAAPHVRAAAAQTFGSLHSTVGSRALDEVVPNLMKKLGDTEEGEYALDGLGQILAVKSKAVMPFLIPQLTARPVNTKALSILASVAGDSLSKHLGKILPAVLGVLAETSGTEREKEELEYCERMILTITDEQGVRLLLDELLSHSKTENNELKKSAVKLLSIFCIHTKADLEPYIAQLIRGLIQLMTETDPEVLLLVADALTAVVKMLDSAEKMAYVADVRQAVRFVHSDIDSNGTLPGLCTPKGISPLLPIFREALLNGGADLKEQAALGMGEVIALSTEVALKPSVVHVTGPLIRILGDRYGPNVKTAVLDTLTLLLIKVGIHLKAFLPQLQTTFLKSTSDSNRNVRLKAAAALAQLIPIHPKPDPMLQELINSVRQADK